MAASFRFLFFISVVFLPLPLSAHAQRLPSEVLVVYNAASPVSTAVAKDYAAKRHVTHTLAVRCVDSALNTANETIPLADYQSEIAAPISRYLAQHTKINFLVLTKGMPIRIRGGITGEASQGMPQPSLDSYLAAIDYPAIPGAVKASLAGSGTTGTGWINRYYNATVPFTHAKFGGYLVTRLDGYTQADAMGLVTQALAAERVHRPGKILFDIEPDFGVGDKRTQPPLLPATVVSTEAPWDTWNADMFHASDILEANGIPHMTAVTKEFIGDQAALAGYFSWGSNDDHFRAEAYQSLRFAPGSLCDTAVSTSGRTFLPTTGGQTLMADLIAHGLTCCQGYVGEPILDGISSPTIDLKHYLAGDTMAESFYAGSRYVGWETVCIGDPLCCPYAGRKLLSPTLAADFQTSAGSVKTEPCSESGLNLGFLSNGVYTSYKNINLTGITRVAVRVSGAGPGGRIEFRLDSPHGKLIGTCAVHPTGDWQIWNTQTGRLDRKVSGIHTLFLVYTGGDGNLFNLEWFALGGNDDSGGANGR